jgi:predicted transcriptional regulator
MKFLLYLITFYLNEDYIYDSTILNTTSSKVSALIINSFLPEIDSLLARTQNEAVSTMTIKLLVVLFDMHPNFIKKFQEFNKIQIILKNGYFQEGANTNVLKLIQKCISVESIITKSVPNWINEVFTQNYKILMNSLSTGQ